MFDEILTISGKPGLYQLKTRTKSGFVAESLLDGKRISVSARHNVTLLAEIAIFTLHEEVPLREVFNNIKEKEDGGPTSVGHNDGKDALEAYFFEVLPDYDEDRVYLSDIQKVVRWYNLIQQKGILDFEDTNTTPEEGEEEKDRRGELNHN